MRGDVGHALLPGIDRCRQFLGKTFIELRVNTTPWVGRDEDGNEQGGTLDFGCVGEELIVISDLKFGRNIPVEAIRNYQQVLYALGFYHQVAKHITKATKFLIIIDQPRNSAGGGEWPVELAELEAIGEWIKVRAAETFDPAAPCTPSKDACTWCPAAKKMGACPEYEAWQISMLEQEIQDLDDFDAFGSALTVPDVSVMTPARITAIYMHRAMLSPIEVAHFQIASFLAEVDHRSDKKIIGHSIDFQKGGQNLTLFGQSALGHAGNALLNAVGVLDLEPDKVRIPLKRLADWAVKGQHAEFGIAEYERYPEGADFVVTEFIVNLRDVSAFKIEVLIMIYEERLLAAQMDVDGFIAREDQIAQAEGRDVVLW
jgi:hypothetical protein